METSVVVGLGNAGERYRGTRHNVGFSVVDELANRWQVAWIDGEAVRRAHGSFAGRAVLLIQPQLLMNRSGEAFAEFDPTRGIGGLIVVHDEIDLPCGRLRVKLGGGTAGHRGVASVAAYYGSDFTRVRVGIGRPVDDACVADHVLQRFAPEEQEVMDAATRSAAEAVECVLEHGPQVAMQRFNGPRVENRPAPENE